MTLHDAEEYINANSWLIRHSGGFTDDLIEEAVRYLIYGDSPFATKSSTAAANKTKAELSSLLTEHLRRQTDHYGTVFRLTNRLYIPTIVRLLLAWWFSHSRLHRLRFLGQ